MSIESDACSGGLLELRVLARGIWREGEIPSIDKKDLPYREVL
jgi:hypothetical protein